MERHKNKIPLIAGIIFLLTAVTAVAIAWISDIHRFDLSISFSSYVGLSRLTSIMYFVSAVIMIAMLIYYIVKTKMNLLKRIVYAVVLLCVFGTAFFPFNYYSEAPTSVTINLHNDFAIALMLATTVSFVLSVIFAKNKKQRIVNAVSIGYAIVFIVLYLYGLHRCFRRFSSGKTFLSFCCLLNSRQNNKEKRLHLHFFGWKMQSFFAAY